MMVQGPHLTWAKGKGQAFALPGASQKSRLLPYLLLSRDKVALPQIRGGSPCIQFARFCTFLEDAERLKCRITAIPHLQTLLAN